MSSTNGGKKEESIEEEIDEIEREVDVIEKEVDLEIARTHRLQAVVYPSLAAFVLLASYGFYLIYSLTQSMNSLASDMAMMTRSVDSNMNKISIDMRTMTHNSNVMAYATANMQRDMWSLNNNISPPLNAMNSMIPWGANNTPYYGSNGRIPYPPPRQAQPGPYTQQSPQQK